MPTSPTSRAEAQAESASDVLAQLAAATSETEAYNIAYELTHGPKKAPLDVLEAIYSTGPNVTICARIIKHPNASTELRRRVFEERGGESIGVRRGAIRHGVVTPDEFEAAYRDPEFSVIAEAIRSERTSDADLTRLMRDANPDTRRVASQRVREALAARFPDIIAEGIELLSKEDDWPEMDHYHPLVGFAKMMG